MRNYQGRGKCYLHVILIFISANACSTQYVSSQNGHDYHAASRHT